MSLLDTASLIVTPNAYKEGKLYSVIPSDGSGDLSVTRATTATRVNSDGLVELVPYNLFRYSEQFNNAAWELNVGTTITANYATAPNGTLTADRYVGTGSSGVIQRFTFSAGQVFTISFYVKSNTGVSQYCRLYGSSIAVSSDIEVTTEWQRISFDFTSDGLASRAYGILRDSSNNDIDILIWGAQLVEGTEAKDYYPTETRLNIPRLDYSLGGCPSILVEPQRTNLALFSDQFNDANWNKLGATISANATTAPNGITSADNLIPSNGTQLSWVLQNFASVAGTTYTFSMYVKSTDFSFFQITGSSGFNTEHQNYNISNGTLASNSGVAGTITSAGNGWYRITYSLLCISTEAAARFICTVQNSGTAGRLDSCTGNGTKFVSLWGAQLEAGAYPTSYIPTTSASVTRNADFILKTGISSLIGQTEGTLFMEFNSKQLESYTQRLISLSDGTTTNVIGIQIAPSNQIAFYITNGSVLQFVITTSTPAFTLGTNVKIAAAYKANDFVLYVNGVQIGTVTSGTLPATSQLKFAEANGTNPYNGNIQATALWKTRLTDDQLEVLTTI